VLILLPASDAKHQIESKVAFDLAGLSFAALGPTRERVLDALVEASAAPDAMRRLGVPASRREVLQQHRDLSTAPAAPVEDVYAGVLHEAAGLATLDAAARRLARNRVVIVSALWGAVRPGDRIPEYRLDMCGRLPGLEHLPDVWRPGLGDVLPRAAGRGLLVDCRSAEYATAWRPQGPLAERTVVLRVMREDDRTRGAGSHHAKRTRGLVVRRILVDALDPRRPEDLAEALSAYFHVELHPPDAGGTPSELRIVEQRS
jgi:cytoplasmic iron level regulating protein YaaA (DUF328/UPF0246 family)